MNSNKIILSIITVNFNNNQGLIRTLDCLKKQDFSSYEHIIIDADSTDGSQETIKKYEKSTPYHVSWISEPDKGIYDGMNKGIERAVGEYIYFLNSGDILTDNVLNKVPFDGTQYIYGNAIVQTLQKAEKYTFPEVPDLFFFSNNSLAHQSSFIHHSLFKKYKYDINYKIVSDWGHSIRCIILDGCTYKHLDFTISICDGNGVSSDLKAVIEERIQWIQANLSIPLGNSFIECAEIEKSVFRPIIPLLNKTRKFQKRAKKIIMFLYRVNAFFSRH